MSGRTVTNMGYVKIRVPDHPRSVYGYVFEHILMAEAAVGHHLPLGVAVHHRNRTRDDNRPDNFIVCENNGYHTLIHAREDAYRATGDPNQRVCKFCGEWVLPGAPGIATAVNRGHFKLSYHRSCCATAARKRYAQKIARTKGRAVRHINKPRSTALPPLTGDVKKLPDSGRDLPGAHRARGRR